MMKDILPKYVKRTLIIAVSIIIPLILIYFIAVTVSRFEESSLNIDAGESMMYYLGHSMLTFNYGVMDTIQNYANGAYMFDCSSLRISGLGLILERILLRLLVYYILILV